jgi:hypothetical protein
MHLLRKGWNQREMIYFLDAWKVFEIAWVVQCFAIVRSMRSLSLLSFTRWRCLHSEIVIKWLNRRCAFDHHQAVEPCSLHPFKVMERNNLWSEDTLMAALFRWPKSSYNYYWAEETLLCYLGKSLYVTVTLRIYRPLILRVGRDQKFRTCNGKGLRHSLTKNLDLSCSVNMDFTDARLTS